MTSGKQRAAAPAPGTRRATSGNARDQEKSSFTAILESLIMHLPGASAAALVDSDGECVDYGGDVDPFDVKVCAAHWRLVLDHVPRALGTANSLVVQGTRRSFIAYRLPDGYALVVLLRRRAGLTASSRAFFETERELAREAGWLPSRQARHWFRVRVECDKRRRPVMLLKAPGDSLPLEILGAVASGLGARESGYRVRVDSGVELTLVREPGGRWYAEEAPHEPTVPPRACESESPLAKNESPRKNEPPDEPQEEPDWKNETAAKND